MLKKIVKMLTRFPENCIFVKTVTFGARQLLEQPKYYGTAQGVVLNWPLSNVVTPIYIHFFSTMVNLILPVVIQFKQYKSSSGMAIMTTPDTDVWILIVTSRRRTSACIVFLAFFFFFFFFLLSTTFVRITQSWVDVF